jgi:hypothetical protein
MDGGVQPACAVLLPLLAVVKRSPAYRLVRWRLGAPQPEESWFVAGHAYYTFALRTMPEAPDSERFALFVVEQQRGVLVMARIVTVRPAMNKVSVEEIVV